ncbi:MAG: TadE family protein [Planctomycetota bacterium]
MQTKPNKEPTTCLRHGAAMVEMAICLPVLVLLVWGTIEIANSIHAKQVLLSAAHEGAMLAQQPSVTDTEVLSKVNAVLTARQVDGCTITLVGDSGQAYTSLTPGELFQITVSRDDSNHFVNISSVSVVVKGMKQ